MIWELAEKVEPEHGIRLRKMRRRSLRKELDVFVEIYNEAWKDNWGFVPFSDAGARRTTPRSCSSSSTRTGS